MTAKTVAMRPRSWLWANRLQRGKVNNLQGDPGDGKSLFFVDLAMCVTRGEKFADGAVCEQGDVIILSGEETLDDTLLPRLLAAGADLSRVHVWALDRQNYGNPPTFPQHRDWLKEWIEKVKALLVVIDPFEGFLDEKTDPNANPSVREAMAALGWVASRTQTCIVVVRHLTKDPRATKAKYRGSGSIAITGAARSNWHIGPNPKDDTTKVFAPVKNNDSAPGTISTLSFRIIGVQIEHDDLTEPIEAPAIEWLGEVDVTADEVLTGRGGSIFLYGNDEDEDAGQRGAAPNKRQSAEEFLKEALADGQKHDSEEILQQGQAQGLKRGTIWNARKKVGVQCKKRGFGRGAPWDWWLSPQRSL